MSSQLGRCAFFAALFLVMAGCQAEPATESAPRYQLAGFAYDVHVSADGDPDGLLPMVVGLHFLGGGPQTSVADYADPDFPIRLILLAGPYEFEGGYSWFPDGEEFYDQAPEQQLPVILQMAGKLGTFLAAVATKYPTLDRPLVTGFSQGADLVYTLALRHPNQVSAALPMGGRLMPALAESLEEGREYPEVTILHGEEDPIVPIGEARAAYSALRNAGLQVEFLTYADTGHDYPAAMKNDYLRSIRAHIARMKE